MAHAFDPGYTTDPFLTLCSDYPEAAAYPTNQFRSEWGPIFHRGRKDPGRRSRPAPSGLPCKAWNHEELRLRQRLPL